MSARDICTKCGLIFYPSGACPRCEAAALRARLREVEAERDVARDLTAAARDLDALSKGHALVVEGMRRQLTQARAEVERMRPVVEAAVARFSTPAGDAPLMHAIDAYLASTPKEGA